MVVRIALKELQIRKKMYLFVMVQLIITYFIAIIFVSIIANQYQKYHAFKEYFDLEGMYLYFTDIFTPENTGMLNSEMLESYLKSADALCCYVLFGDIEKAGKKIDTYNMIYDDAIISNYEPAIQEGRWLSGKDNESEVVEAVVSQNQNDLKVGDILQIRAYSGKLHEKTVPIKIVGVLENGAQIYDLSYTENMVNCQNCYRSIDVQYEETPVLIMNRENIKNCEIKMIGNEELLKLRGTVLLTWREGITDAEKRFNQKFMEDNAFISLKEDMKTFRQKSFEEINSSLRQYFPVLICGFALTLISTMSVGVIAAKQQLKHLAIYNMLGLPWNKCIWIQEAVFAMIVLKAMVITGIFTTFLQLSGGLKHTLIEIGVWQIIVCIALSVCCAVVSGILEFLVVKNTNTRELLQKGE